MTILDSLFSFSSQSMITKKLLTSGQFHEQAQSSSQFVKSTTWRDLYVPHAITREVINANKLISGLGTNVLWVFRPNFTITETFEMIGIM
jgi:hypothetical protein